MTTGPPTRLALCKGRGGEVSVQSGSIDPITLEVVRGSLVSTVLQMRATLVRTAYAPILYETKDFSCGLMTADGELGAMSEDFSGHVFAMALGLNAAREKFKDDFSPGDVIAVNDPYTGGTHMNDIAFYTPFFVDGKVLLYIGVRAHHQDVGGATPGSFSGQDTEIYQEGVRIVPVKLVEKGNINRGLWDVLFANMRLPDERVGDVLAMLDTARVAEVAIAELFAKYGNDVVEACIEALMDSGEETMRACIRELPNGEYAYEHYMDNGGLSPEPLPLRVELTIEDDSMTFDFTGTAKQVVGPMNCGIPVTRGGAFVVVKSWLDPKTPVNGGSFRPLQFVIPEGSCLAAQLPAPVGGCWELYREIQSAVVGVFAQFLPHDLGGENIGACNHIYVGGFDPVRKRPFILYEYPHGGVPASHDTDGATGTNGSDAGDLACVQQAESIEQRLPLMVESLAMSTDREGAGRQRSGWGTNRRIRVLADTSLLSVMTDRAVIPPFGAGGAPPGSVNAVTVLRDGQELQPSPVPGKVKGFQLNHGDVVLAQATAGGGVGDPLERDVELVREEVFEGYIRNARARDVYGVVIEEGEVDSSKTRQLREQIRSQRPYLQVVDGASDEYDGRGCRVGRLSKEAALLIGVADDDMIEYVRDDTAPLRAWVRVSEGLPGDGVPLGPLGRAMLKIDVGESIWVRHLETTEVGV